MWLNAKIRASPHEAGALAAFGRREQGDREDLCVEWLRVLRRDAIDAFLFESKGIRWSGYRGPLVS